MYIWWLLSILLIALSIIIFIISRHFSALAILDVENIPEEKEEKIKEKIIKERIKRKFSFWDKFFNKILDFFDKVSNSFWEKLNQLKQEQKNKNDERALSNISLEEKIRILLSQADALVKKEDFVEAEKKLIEVISLDDKNFPAFWELGEVYHSQSKWQESKQTLLYALKLAELKPENISSSDISNLNYSLALINKEINNIEASFDNALKASELEPNNPRYLDLILGLCIIKKEKKLALEYLEKIKESNPDNNNISKWQEQIDLLPM